MRSIGTGALGVINFERSSLRRLPEYREGCQVATRHIRPLGGENSDRRPLSRPNH